MSEGLKMRYFVLNPTKDSAYGGASREALRTYAEYIHAFNPQLADDLHNWADTLDTGGEEDAQEAPPLM